MVVTSHLMDEINEFCDRIALIDHGRIVAVGTATELKARVGPNATLDDVFIKLVSTAGDRVGDDHRAGLAAADQRRHRLSGTIIARHAPGFWWSLLSQPLAFSPAWYCWPPLSAARYP